MWLALCAGPRALVGIPEDLGLVTEKYKEQRLGLRQASSCKGAINNNVLRTESCQEPTAAGRVERYVRNTVCIRRGPFFEYPYA